MIKTLGPLTKQEFQITVDKSLRRHKDRIVKNKLKDMAEIHRRLIDVGYKAECADCDSIIEYRFASEDEFSIHLLHDETCPVPKEDRGGGHWCEPVTPAKEGVL